MPENRDFSAGRRAFLRLPSKPDVNITRPPWTDATSVADHCTSCGDCVSVCPESILQTDESGKPILIFDGGECTFCQKCAESCHAGVFDITRTPAWTLKADIQSGCLQEHGISCQICRDNCPASAIKVDLKKRPFGQLKIDTDICTGCAACLNVCPQEVLILNGTTEQRGAA